MYYKNFKGIRLLKNNIFKDDRGDIKVLFDNKVLDDFLIKNIISVQNRKKGTIRGLHYQSRYRQKKIIKVNKGSIFDVFLNINPKDKNYGRAGYIKLDSINNNYLIIDDNYAHGYQTLEDNTEITYFLNNFYKKKYSKIINYNSKILKIKWPLDVSRISNDDKNSEEF